MATHVYPSDLNDDEWALLASLIPPAKPGGRPRSVDIRRILNGLFYVLRSGRAWPFMARRRPRVPVALCAALTWTLSAAGLSH